MGRIGAGAVIEPEYEQVPPEGWAPSNCPSPSRRDDRVRGGRRFDVAAYESGDVIVVYREQRHPLSSFYGEEAAVRLKTGERYLKTIERGKSSVGRQPNQLQRQADQRGQTGMDRRDLRHPAPRADRAPAGASCSQITETGQSPRGRSDQGIAIEGAAVRHFWLALACLAHSASAHAVENVSSGNYMLQHCEHYASNTNRYDVWDGECGGTVASLMYFSNSLDEKTRFCPPKAATNGQAGRVVVAYLRAHPEMLHLDFRALAATALRAAWPCQ
jgi:hypothetical protein